MPGVPSRKKRKAQASEKKLKLHRAVQAETERQHAQEAAQAAQTRDRQRAAQAEAERQHAQEAAQAAQTRDRQRAAQAEAERQHAQEAAQGTSAKVKRCGTNRRTESIDDSSQESALASALALVRQFYEEGNMTRETCACCNELVPPRNIRCVVLSQEWITRLKTRLKWSWTHWPVNDRTKAEYSVTSIFPELAEVPLAKAGVKINKDGNKMVSHDNFMLIEDPA